MSTDDSPPKGWTAADIVLASILGVFQWPSSLVRTALFPRRVFRRDCSYRFQNRFLCRHLLLQRPVFVYDLERLLDRYPDGMSSTLGAHQTFPGDIRLWILNSLPTDLWEAVAAHEIEHAVLAVQRFPTTMRTFSSNSVDDGAINSLLSDGLRCPVAYLANTLLDIIIDNRLRQSSLRFEQDALDDWRYGHWIEGLPHVTIPDDDIVNIGLWVGIYLRCHYHRPPSPIAEALHDAIAQTLPAAAHWASRTIAMWDQYDWLTSRGSFEALNATRQMWGPVSPVQPPTTICRSHPTLLVNPGSGG